MYTDRGSDQPFIKTKSQQTNLLSTNKVAKMEEMLFIFEKQPTMN